MMNELDELVYSLEDLKLSENLNVFMNKGETGGPQGKFEASTSMKQEWQEPENEDKNYANKAITEMEQVFNHASHSYGMLLYSIDEMKSYRAQEYFEYQNAQQILKNYRVFTA